VPLIATIRQRHEEEMIRLAAECRDCTRDTTGVKLPSWLWPLTESFQALVRLVAMQSVSPQNIMFAKRYIPEIKAQDEIVLHTAMGYVRPQTKTAYKDWIIKDLVEIGQRRSVITESCKERPMSAEETNELRLLDDYFRAQVILPLEVSPEDRGYYLDLLIEKVTLGAILDVVKTVLLRDHTEDRT
jgi:hypothetical protein